MTSLIKYNAGVVKFRKVQSYSTCLLWQGGSSQRLWSLNPEWYWQQFTVWGVPSWTSKIEIFLTSAPITTVGLGWGELWLSASNLDQWRKERRKKPFRFLSLCIHQRHHIWHLSFIFIRNLCSTQSVVLRYYPPVSPTSPSL